MGSVIVLVTEGKHESVDYVKVMLFDNRTLALEFCKVNNRGPKKNWVYAEIIDAGTRIELGQADYN